MTAVLTRPAEGDVRAILRETLSLFGRGQVRIYGGIIAEGVRLIGEDPMRLGSIERSEIAPGVRYFHLERAAGRRGAAAHGLYYVVRPEAGDRGVAAIVLRVLHERMEPRARVMDALSEPPAQ